MNEPVSANFCHSQSTSCVTRATKNLSLQNAERIIRESCANSQKYIFVSSLHLSYIPSFLSFTLINICIWSDPIKHQDGSARNVKLGIYRRHQSGFKACDISDLEFADSCDVQVSLIKVIRTSVTDIECASTRPLNRRAS